MNKFVVAIVALTLVACSNPVENGQKKEIFYANKKHDPRLTNQQKRIQQGVTKFLSENENLGSAMSVYRPFSFKKADSIVNDTDGMKFTISHRYECLDYMGRVVAREEIFFLDSALNVVDRKLISGNDRKDRDTTDIQ
jgi:hypothetical protein